MTAEQKAAPLTKAQVRYLREAATTRGFDAHMTRRSSVKKLRDAGLIKILVAYHQRNAWSDLYTITDNGLAFLRKMDSK